MWWNIIIGLVLNYVSWLLRPQPEPPPAGTIDDVSVPKTEEGAEIGWVYGSVWIKDAQVHWFGDFATEPIKSKQGKK